MAHWRCSGSLEMWWLIGDVVAHGNVVAHWRCAWWLIGDMVAHWLEMWWLIGDVVAHWRYGGSLEILWLMEMRWLIVDVHGGSLEKCWLISWRCGGSLKM